MQPRRGGVPGIDGAAVSEWVTARVPGVRGPLRFSAVGNGRSNLTYLAEDGHGGAVIVRRPPLGEALQSAHDVGREHRVLSALHPLGQPVPRPLALCDDVGVTGAPFFVMEKVPGVLVDDAAAATRLDPEPRARAGHAVAETLAALHEVDSVAAGLGEMARGEDHAARQLRRWSRQWEACRTRELALVEEVGERLAAAIPAQQQTTLVHGDYTPNNLLISPGGEVAAILDWELWTLGDPIADLAWLSIWWPADSARSPLGYEPPSAAAGMARIDKLIVIYCQRTGRGLDRLRFWTALSYWKLAIIIEGVYRRWLDDPANGGESAGRIRPRADLMVALALETLEEKEQPA
ncbi:MAG TPA: phosphotransferase family protein [Solirubrobacterales bacterium]|nr:phosphotransferase family protein [Solirubrobacterales bacterium]